MTPALRLQSALRTLHWTAVTLSIEARVSVRLVQYWLAGRYDAPDEVLEWLSRLAAFHEANPAPVRGR